MSSQEPQTIMDQAQNAAANLASTVSDALTLGTEPGDPSTDGVLSSFLVLVHQAVPQLDDGGLSLISHHRSSGPLHRRESRVGRNRHRCATLPLRLPSRSLPIAKAIAYLGRIPYFCRDFPPPQGRLGGTQRVGGDIDERAEEAGQGDRGVAEEGSEEGSGG